MTRVCRDSKGVILIALLWILTALSVIALSFSREGFVEVAVARNTRDLADAYYIARAGLMAAVYQVMQRQLNPGVQQLELQNAPDPVDLGTVTGKFGDGEYVVDIQDESGKINVNLVLDEQLRTLLDVIGIPKLDADTIADSILDWRDADSDHRLNGAEDDYYQSLNPPYKAKNGRLDTVEELLLVRGVTLDYFYGHSEKTPDGSIIYKYGLSRYLTVYSMTPSININYAPVQVLMSIPGITPQMAQMIYERRKVKPFANVNEITQQLPVTLSPNSMPFLSTNRTGIFTLTAWARRENSKVQRAVRAVVSLDAREANQYKIIYWNENVPNL
jgi:general secretion pathway protein K